MQAVIEGPTCNEMKVFTHAYQFFISCKLQYEGAVKVQRRKLNDLCHVIRCVSMFTCQAESDDVTGPSLQLVMTWTLETNYRRTQTR
ncbi:hypothetical protein M758_12G177400 [Ceratodon purpureus]|nr:hypothetical protein M758_12G177400 [Ceratodon purpureus]